MTGRRDYSLPRNMAAHIGRKQQRAEAARAAVHTESSGMTTDTSNLLTKTDSDADEVNVHDCNLRVATPPVQADPDMSKPEELPKMPKAVYEKLKEKLRPEVSLLRVSRAVRIRQSYGRPS